MFVTLLAAQIMVETLNTRAQRAVPATAFRCAMLRSTGSLDSGDRFDISGTTPLAPEGRQPNDSFPLVLGSATGSPIAGRAMANPIRANDWFRDFQVTRTVGENHYVINLKLRREGQSLAYMTVYADWPADAGGEREPFRYDAVGICTADFNPSESDG